MPLYRAVNRLDRGKGKVIPRGETTRLEWLSEEQRERLLFVGAVTKVPALRLEHLGTVLPAWEWRAARLQTCEVETVDDFMSLSDSELADRLGYKPATVAGWRRDLQASLEAEAVKLAACC